MLFSYANERPKEAMRVKRFASRTIVALALCAGITAAVVSAGAMASSGKAKAGGDVCVLLPDTATSIRWVHYDTPALKAAFKAAGVSAQFFNANNDAQTQTTQANQCLGNGAKVVIEVALDAGSASAIEKTAKAKGVPSIDYDRQVKGGVASIYVSFDGRAVGVLQGKGVVAGLKANGKYGSHPVVAELNGGSTDANSFLFKGGYDSVLKPLYASGTLKKGPDQFVPGWDNQKAATILARPQADPAERPGRNPAGPPVHRLWLADDDRLEGHADPGEGGRRRGGRPAEREGAEDDRDRPERVGQGAGVHHPAGRALQEQLDTDLQVRVHQEERRLQRPVREVLQVESPV